MTDLFSPVQPGGNWRLNAIAGGDWESDAGLALGFAELADAGIKEVVSRGPNDALFVPIVFSYRHGFELVLKVAIREAARVVQKNREAHGQSVDPELLSNAIDKELTIEHRLGHLLDKLIALLAEGQVEALPAETVETIRQLHKLDESGQAFRYTMVKDKQAKDKQRPARPDQIHVDVVQLAERLNAAFSLIYRGLLTVLELELEEH